ncbi:uncharacterized protein LOC112883399 isoform X5 [Panicum hallii]|uniref:uncharacterized protein LOC112883399 isoform X5 n=1 Tax=Panicum hallii TaxID=206008 RepID=UPI000DF4D058|nr:uncharacterized protein LOC112883399 isoform X5 [Panicum hallii]
MATAAAAATAASTSLRPPCASQRRLAQSLPRRWCWGIPVRSAGGSAFRAERRRRSTLLCAADKAPEESLKKTIEVDRLIDTLRDANPREKDYEELAENVMNIVDRLVHKTDQKIEQSTDVLKAIISPAMHEGDVKWPPKEPDTLKLMEKEIARREQEGQLDEGFLSEVSAQLRQVKQDGDKPGLQAMLQKVLQLYASKSLQKRSYAYKGGQVVVPEKFLESVIQAPENEWNKVLLDGLTVGKGDVSPDDLYAVISKRIERVLIRTVGSTNILFLQGCVLSPRTVKLLFLSLCSTGRWFLPATHTCGVSKRDTS